MISVSNLYLYLFLVVVFSLEASVPEGKDV